MIRFALIAASTLGFFLTAALGNLMVPPQAPTMGGLCLMVGVLAAVGVGWTAACVAQPELLGAESLFSVRLLTALLGALLFGGVGLLEDLARIRSRSVLGLRRHTRLGLEAAAGAVVLVLLGVLPAALAGSLMAFLLWNFPPAKLRLGSVGSLFLAGMLGCVPLCIGWPDLTLPLALPFWLEGGMVALQILVCKASRGRRQLFRSAPLHRWLELRGQSAEQIFYTFCVIAMLGVALTVQLAKIS